jgi:hypothetical protein
LLNRAGFEAAIAFVGVVSFIAWLIEPAAIENTSVGHTARQLLPAWECLYAAGGVSILIGLFAGSIRVEIAGLSALTSALLVNALAIVDFAGIQGITTAATFGCLGAACIGRIVFLIRALSDYRSRERE